MQREDRHHDYYQNGVVGDAASLPVSDGIGQHVTYGRFIRLAWDHLITLSALASTVGGIVRPICLAVFRLMISSKCFGLSTGRSCGFAPFKIRSTYHAVR